MLTVAILTATLSIHAGQPAADKPRPPSVPPGVRMWPVHVVDGDSHPAHQPPMVVVGALFTGGHCYREDDAGTIHRTPAGEIVMPARLTDNKYSKAMGEYLLGNIRPRPSCDEEETCVFVVSPPLDPHDTLRVDSIAQQGNTFTLSASHWRSDRKITWGPGPNHSAQMVRLGWLPPGDYTLRFHLTEQLEQAAGPNPAGLHITLGTRTATTSFTVAKGDAWNFHSWDQPLSTSVIKQADLSSTVAPIPADGMEPMHQQPFFAFKTMPAPAEKTDDACTLLLTPPLDWRKHSQSAATLWTPLPADHAESSPTLVAHITGGTSHTLGKWDWAEVSNIVWNHTTATIQINIWRKDYIYGNNKTRRAPQFAIPLESRHLGDAPADWTKIKVLIDWREGTDNPRNAVEEVRR